ncbi:Importin-11 [Blyttiomyces sp. JEL0837]|nr:Importin-11 [Blyttiomyces sp. JEL0837]
MADTIIPFLARAVASDKDAEAQLKIWETIPGYYSALLEISSNQSLDHAVRHLAALYFKNGIDKYWRKTATHALQRDEKVEIRSQLMALLFEPSNKLARAYAEGTAKIARIDFPTEWPDLLHVILASVQASFNLSTPNQDPANRRLAQQHSLYTLHRVVKGLYTMKTARGKQVLYQIGPELFRYLSTLYYEKSESILSQLNGSIPMEAINVIELEGHAKVALMALKSLRRLIVHGFPDRVTRMFPDKLPFNQIPECLKLFESLTTYLGKFLQIRTILPKPDIQNIKDPNASSPWRPVHRCITKMSLLIGKLYLDLLEERMMNFCVVPGSMSIPAFYWSHVQAYTLAGGDEMYERILLQGLRIIRHLVDNSKFAHNDPDRHPDSEEAHKVIHSQLLTQEFISSCTQVLISKYLPLGQEDLEKWESEPETFVSEEEADQWEFSLRMCAEKLLMDLMKQARALVGPQIIQMLQQAAEVTPAADLKSILLKEAIYSAVALGAYELHDYMDFDSWLDSKLMSEAQIGNNVNPHWAFIRRAIVNLIGEWIAVKSGPEMRPKIYTLLISLMSPSESSLVVRLTSIGILRIVAEQGWLSDGEIFLPHAEVALGGILVLLDDSEEFETKMMVINCLSTIAQLMGKKIGPYVHRVINELPRLWDSSQDQIMFRTALLLLLQALMKALKEQSIELHPIIVPAIEYSIEPTQKLNFFEDGIDLWLTTLQNATELTPQLNNLYPYLLNLLDLSSENLIQILRVVKAYATLNPSATIQHPTTIPIFARLAVMITELKLEAIKAVLGCVGTVIRACLVDGVVEPAETVMVTSGLWNCIVQACVDSVARGQVDYVTADLAGLVCLVGSWDPGFVLRGLRSVGESANPPRGALVQEFLETCGRVYDAMTHERQRKELVMSLTSLLATGDPEVVAHIQEVFVCVSGALASIDGLSEEEAHIKFFKAVEIEDDEEETLDYTRRLAQQNRDPLVTTSLRAHVKSKLAECENGMGGAEVFRAQVLSKCDPHILNEVLKRL